MRNFSSTWKNHWSSYKCYALAFVIQIDAFQPLLYLKVCKSIVGFNCFCLFLCTVAANFRQWAYIFLKYFCLVDGRSVVPANGIVFGRFDTEESKRRVSQIIHLMQPIDTVHVVMKKRTTKTTTPTLINFQSTWFSLHVTNHLNSIFIENFIGGDVVGARLL